MNDENALLALWCHLPLGRRRAGTTLRGRRFRSPGFPSQSRNDIFLALAARSGDWRSSVQNSSNRHREMGRKESAPGRENSKNLAKRRIQFEGHVYEGKCRETILDVFREG